MIRENKNKCEGSCEIHTGIIQEVNVRDFNHDWGNFFYCQSAIKEDVTRGLHVIKIDLLASTETTLEELKAM